MRPSGSQLSARERRRIEARAAKRVRTPRLCVLHMRPGRYPLYVGAEQLAEPGRVPSDLADDIVVGILADSSYINGLKHGYRLGQDGNETEYQQIIRATRKLIREARAEFPDDRAMKLALDATTAAQGSGGSHA